MANNIPNVAVPFYNIHQYILNARSSSIKTSADITIPNYISDKRVLAGINYSNLPYLNGISNLEPSYPERYYYLELTLCIEPIIQKLFIAPWLGYALFYKRTKVIQMLLSSGLDIYQKMIMIDHKHFPKGARNIAIQEAACILQIYNQLESTDYEELKEVFKIMIANEVNLARPIEVRSQIMDEISVISNEAFCYRDIWDFLDTKINKLPPTMKTTREIFIKDLKEFVQKEIENREKEKV